MRKFTFLKMMLLAVVMVAGSVGLAQETAIYTTGFESTDGFTATNVYNNTAVEYTGASGKQWGTYYGTPSTTSPITSAQSMQMRWYTSAPDNKGYTITDFDLPKVTKVTFKAKNTTGINVIASYSTDGGTSFQGDETFTLSTTATEYTYNISSTGEHANVRIKFALTYSTAPTTTSRLYLDDVTVFGISDGTVPTSAPVFTPGSGTYTSTQNVELTSETAGAKIYYTTDGTEPSNTSTEYTAAIPVSTTTTIKAIAYADGLEPSSVASATYTFPPSVADIAAFLATTETGNVIISGPVTVVYQNGQNLYIQDSSGSLLVYGNLGKTFTNGDQLTGLMGTLGTYGQSPQMTSPTAPDAVSGTEVSPIVVDLSTISTADLAKYVKVENVQFSADVTFSTSSTVNGTLVAPVGFTVRDNFRLGGSVLAGKNYDIIGFISYYNGTAQIFPVSITEVATTTPSITTDPTSLDFGSVDIGAVSAVKTVTVTGTNLTAAPAYSVNNTEFSVTGTLTTAGGTLTVTYSPAAAVAGNGIITISGNGQTVTVVLTGSGVLPSLSKPVATDATGISQTGFTANWNAVDGAESYKLDVYTKSSTGSVKAADLFFSEYVEGSSNNKYLEIYNGTGATVDLSSYKVVLFANGGTTATNTYELTGEIENGAVIVLRNSSASIYTGESIVSSTTNFNGDDAVALMKGDAYVDIIGKVGEDPGTEWVADGGYSTLNKTLVRKSSVTSGVTTNPDAGFPTLATEWDVYDIDNVSNLGSHTLTDQLMETKTLVTGSPFTTTSTSQAVSGLVNTGIYFYTVTAVRGTEESPLSNEIGPISLTATGLSTAKVDALAWTSNGKVMLNASAGEVIEIFNVAGQKVVSRLAVDGLNSVDVSAKGVVIVRVNNRISKVIL